MQLPSEVLSPQCVDGLESVVETRELKSMFFVEWVDALESVFAEWVDALECLVSRIGRVGCRNQRIEFKVLCRMGRCPRVGLRVGCRNQRNAEVLATQSVDGLEAGGSTREVEWEFFV